jgi:DNA-binding MarR family transcriptional regulator
VTHEDLIAVQASEMVRAIHALADCCEDKELRSYSQFGLTVAEGHFLEALGEWDSSTPGAIAEALSVARSRITRIADGLVRKGLIDRCVSESDRRFQRLCLTDRGKEILSQTKAYRASVHVRLLAGFDGAKRQSLLSDLKLLAERMDAVRGAL